MEQTELAQLLCGELHGDAERVAKSLAFAAEELERLGLGDAVARFAALLPDASALSDAISAACGEAQEAYEAKYGQEPS